MDLQKLKAVKATNDICQSPAEDRGRRRFTRKPSSFRDIEMLHCSQSILNIKVAAYQALSLMASALQQDNTALLAHF
jgi:hypothetical protein